MLSKRKPNIRQIYWTVFLHNHQMEYAQSLELQRYFRVGVVPLGDTGEDVVADVQRRLESKEYASWLHILYMTNQTNFGCGIQSPFGSFFVDFVSSCLFLALLECIRFGVCL